MSTYALRTYNLFISHAWSASPGYNRLVGLLDAAPRFQWRNYSAPRDRPVVDSGTMVGRRALTDALKDQIRPVHCVLIVSGMYANHREWIQTEIEIAEAWDKPIVGIRPWGSERTPSAVSDVAREMVSWSTGSIVDAVRRHSA